MHLGARGSIIRPSEITDVQAAETILEKLGRDWFIVSSANSDASIPLMQLVGQQQFGMISCGEDAEVNVKDLVMNRGGIECGLDGVAELLRILDGYLGILMVTKGK